MKRLSATIIAVAATLGAFAQEAPAPETCPATAADVSAVSVTHGGKTYWLKNEACRTQFLSDAERYAQLYDALAELAAAGKEIESRNGASLVPS